MDELSFPAFLSWQGQQLGVLIYLLVVQTNTIVNACGSLRLGACSEPARWPKVAVLVPARNEEATIAACIRSLVRQDYPNFTLWSLDDQSTDRTGAILADEAAQSAKLHILSGQPLPVGWVGKTWACHQLAAAAGGDVLLFVDSDTWHHPRMVRDAVAMLLAEGRKPALRCAASGYGHSDRTLDCAADPLEPADALSRGARPTLQVAFGCSGARADPPYTQGCV